MLEDTYGHTSYHKAFELLDVYGIGFDSNRAQRKKIRLAFIGAGGVAQSKYFPAVSRLRMIWEPVEIVAFAEPREDQAKKVQTITGCRWYSDYKIMLAEEEIDAVLVLGPDDLHAEHTLACLNAKLPVMVEKPISRSLVEAQEMCKKADQTGMVFMTVAMMRFAPPYRRAKNFINDGPVNNPALIVNKFNLGYDYVDLLEQGTIHMFDLTRYLMGDISTVWAIGINKYNNSIRNYPIDNASINFEFSSGAIGTLYTSSTALSFKPWTRVEVYGNHAWLSVEDQHELLLYDGERDGAKSWKPVVTNTLLFDEEFGGYMGLIENFLQVVRGEEKPTISTWDGYKAFELARASQLSIIHREEIKLPIDPESTDVEIHSWLKKYGWPGNM